MKLLTFPIVRSKAQRNKENGERRERRTGWKDLHFDANFEHFCWDQHSLTVIIDIIDFFIIVIRILAIILDHHDFHHNQNTWNSLCLHLGHHDNRDHCQQVQTQKSVEHETAQRIKSTEKAVMRTVRWWWWQSYFEELWGSSEIMRKYWYCWHYCFEKQPCFQDFFTGESDEEFVSISSNRWAL